MTDAFDFPPLDELGEDDSHEYRFDTQIEEGVYPAVVLEAESGESQAGNPMITVVVGVDGPNGGFKGRIFTTFTEGGRFRARELYAALGIAGGKIDLAGLVGLACRVRIKHEQYQGRWEAKADRILPPEEGAGHRRAAQPSGLASDMGVGEDEVPF